VFALIVGIDNYRGFPLNALHGCVVDSINVANYLQSIVSGHVETLTSDQSVFNFLGTPSKSPIVTLQNGAASRSNIIEVFKAHLINNDNIKQGDAIIFYFAGHGSRQKVPHGWRTDGWFPEEDMVEVICPHDYALRDNRDNIPGIPDRTMGALLIDLANNKGNNIVSLAHP
jgi:hypothetical protein